jgi:toxin ParE1/3/4
MARGVVYAPEADEDLLQLYKYIAEHSGPERARGYVARIEAYCMRLAQFPERGSRRDDLRPGLWISGFERQASIAFHVTAATVFIDRVLYGGRDLERSLLGGGEG